MCCQMALGVGLRLFCSWQQTPYANDAADGLWFRQGGELPTKVKLSNAQRTAYVGPPSPGLFLAFSR